MWAESLPCNFEGIMHERLYNIPIEPQHKTSDESAVKVSYYF